jgi:hypothetical protein
VRNRAYFGNKPIVLCLLEIKGGLGFLRNSGYLTENIGDRGGANGFKWLFAGQTASEWLSLESLSSVSIVAKPKK